LFAGLAQLGGKALRSDVACHSDVFDFVYIL
jgi:hypothetical protein